MEASRQHYCGRLKQQGDGIQLCVKKLSSYKIGPTVNDRTIRGQMTSWQWECRKGDYLGSYLLPLAWQTSG